jgi:hypothetical protein
MTSNPRSGFDVEYLPVDTTGAVRRAWQFYVVCDVSQSMWDETRWRDGDSPLDVMNTSLSLMLESLNDHNEAAAIGRISIITFAESATTHYPLTRIDEPDIMRPLPRGSWTNYLDVWEHLNERLTADLAVLRTQGFSPKRPVVFFITDGNAGAKGSPQPIGMWKPLHDKLCSPGFDERPRIVALGMGDVDTDTVLAIRSTDPPGPACLARRGEPASTLLDAIIKVVIDSIGMSAASGAFRFSVPAGMTRLDRA